MTQNFAAFGNGDLDGTAAVITEGSGRAGDGQGVSNVDRFTRGDFDTADRVGAFECTRGWLCSCFRGGIGRRSFRGGLGHRRFRGGSFGRRGGAGCEQHACHHQQRKQSK